MGTMKGQSSKLNQDQLLYLEKMGIYFEREGFPRMAGRIFALLLTDPGGQLSASDIVAKIHVSRGSVSTMTRFLIERGLVEKTGSPGKREDLFRLKPDALSAMFAQRVSAVQEFRELLQTGLRMTDPKSPNSRYMAEMADFYNWMESRMPELWKEWEENRNKKSSG